jgi:RimJ/RimL family protein N-acetyltransferase
MASIPDSPYKILRTERLIIRVFDPSIPTDYEAVISLYDGPYAHKTVGNPGVRTRADLDARCLKFPPRPSTLPATAPFPSHTFHLIYLASSPSTLVGLTSLFLRPPLPSADIGYFIDEPYIGQGFATEAAAAVLKWWTEEMHVPNIWAGTFDNNFASQRVAKKLGLRDGGVIKIVLSDTITREGRAFVQLHMGRSLDGLIVDLRQKGTGYIEPKKS